MKKNDKPIVALVVPALEEVGGVQEVADFFYRTIEKSGVFDVRLISLATSATDKISVSISRPCSWLKGVRTESGVWKGRPYVKVGAYLSEFEFQRYRYRKLLRSVLDGTDIIQVVCGSPAWANAVLNLGKPVSLQVATLAKFDRRRRFKNIRSLAEIWRWCMTVITNWFDNRVLKKVDAIQVENLWMLEYSKKLNMTRPAVDIRFVTPGIDTNVFHPLPKREPLKNPYILCVGRLHDPRKNVGLLLDVLRQLPKYLNHVTLVTTGASEPTLDYWSRAEKMGLTSRVRHIASPSIDELVRLYQNATVFALPSDEEGLGLVVLEAMSCGIPVVATKCGGPDDVIKHGINGFLVMLDDAKAMSEHIAQLCEDEKLNIEMGKKARETIELKYAEDVVGQVFIDVLEKLLKINKVR